MVKSLPGTNKAADEVPSPFVVEDFGGLDTKAKRPAIGPKDFFWIENWLPIGPGNMRTLYSENSTPIYTAANPRTILFYYFYNIGSTRYCAIFLDNGTAVQVNTETLANTTISATANKFYSSGTLPGCSQYQSKFLAITSQVSEDAYWLWNGSSLFGPGTLAPEVTMLNSGKGYASAPTVTAYGGTGSGATFSATVNSQGNVTTVDVTGPGSGWLKDELVTLVFTGGGASADQARGTATITTASGGVSIVTVTAGGSAYTSPAVTFAGGGGAGAAAFVSGMADGVITEITVTNPGTGYTSNPTVTIAGATGAGATSICEIQRGQITAITINSGGSGYTGVPDVRISAPNDFAFPSIQAVATAAIAAGAVSAITITNPGVGYKSATVDFLGGNNSAAATVKIMPFGIKGTSIETYSERVWVATDTKYSYTGAATVADFSSAGGGGSKPVTDAYLKEKVIRLIQANGFLYRFGDSSINVISNVQTSVGGVTTFNDSNVDAQIGSAWRDTIVPFGRALVFANPTGVYALAGGAAEKVSGALDGLFLKANFTSGLTPSACVATVFAIRWYCLLFTTTDPYTLVERNLMVMWDGQRWVGASQEIALKILAGQEISSTLSGYGATTTSVYKMFQRASTGLTKRFSTKLVAQTSYILTEQVTRVYYIAQTETSVGGNLNIGIDTETGFGTAKVNAVSFSVSWTNNAGATTLWSGAASAAASFTSPGLVVDGYDDSNYGQLIGATVDTTVPDLTMISMTLLLKDYSQKA